MNCQIQNMRRHRLVVRTADFQSVNRGSIPLGATKTPSDTEGFLKNLPGRFGPVYQIESVIALTTVKHGLFFLEQSHYLIIGPRELKPGELPG